MGLNDREIDAYITSKIQKRGITLYDIIGGPSVDPEPCNWEKSFPERVRSNRFSTDYSDTRLCELLTEGEFDPDNPYKRLAIPIKDLVRYWWNNIADQEAVIEEIFDAIMTHYKDSLLPEEPEEERPDYSDAFDQVVEVI